MNDEERKELTGAGNTLFAGDVKFSMEIRETGELVLTAKDKFQLTLARLKDGMYGCSYMKVG